jgi:hypothetical protein
MVCTLAIGCVIISALAGHLFADTINGIVSEVAKLITHTSIISFSSLPEKPATFLVLVFHVLWFFIARPYRA